MANERSAKSQSARGDSTHVFDSWDRTNFSPALYSEPSADFLNRIAGDYWDQVRQLVVDWVDHVPIDARPNLVGRLRASDNRHSGAAFWELYLHETFIRCGYEVQIHPAVSTSPRAPDFLVSNDSESFYVEAKAVFAKQAIPGATIRGDQFLDSLSHLSSPNFYLAIDVNQVGWATQSTKRLRADVEAWLGALDPDRPTHSGREVFCWAKQGWDIVLRPIPIRREMRGMPDHRVLALIQPAGVWLDDAATLREALKSKGTAYGDLTHPLVLAVNVSTSFHEHSDTIGALFGSEKLEFSLNHPDRGARNVRGSDGYWGHDPNWRHKPVAGVVIGENVLPWGVAATSPTMWHHPDPIQSVATPPGWWAAQLVDGRIEYAAPTRTANEVLELSPEWPLGAPFRVSA